VAHTLATAGLAGNASDERQAANDRRRLRYLRRATVARYADRLMKDRRSWKDIGFKRQAGCGRMVCGEQAEARVTFGDNGPNAYLVGVSSCGSVWACAVCSAKIRTRRQMEVEQIGALHLAAGGSFAMITLTVRHTFANSLAELLDAQAFAWRTIQRDRRWMRLRKGDERGPRGGLIGKNGDGPLLGTIRAKEVTQGLRHGVDGSGWHPHDHILLLWRDGEDHEADTAWIADRWADLIDSRLQLRPDSHGYHYLSMGAESVKYVTKIANETARGDLKAGSRQVWGIFDALADGELWACDAFVEYHAATKGKAAIQMSRGLRDHFGLAPALTDEEIVNAKEDGLLVEKISKNQLHRLMWTSYGLAPRIVDYLEGIEYRFRDGPPAAETAASDSEPCPASA
jgi:hypothetical protein